MISITEIMESVAAQSKREATVTAISEARDEKLQELREKLYEQQRELESRYDEQAAAVKAAAEAELEKTPEPSVPVSWQDKLIYVRLYELTQQLPDLSFTVESYAPKTDRNPVPELEYVTPTCLVKCFIVGNNKPVNKVSVVIIGRHSFTGTDIFIREFGSTTAGIRLTSSAGTDIEEIVKDFPSHKLAEQWLEKNDVFAGVRAADQKWRQRMEEIRTDAAANPVQWRRFYLETRKEWYEYSYSGYQANTEYQAIVKELEEM